MKAAAAATFAMATRTARATARRPILLVFSFLQPMTWMLLFGFLYQRFDLGALPAQVSYLAFLTPGIAVMTVLFGASQSGAAWIRDRQSQFLQRLVCTPAGGLPLLAGKVGADALRLLLQAVFIVALGAALGARLHGGVAAVTWAAAYLAAFALAYCCTSSWIGLRVANHESFGAFVHVVNMPLLFTSTAFVPVRRMPAWLAEIARFNPVSLVADGVRAALVFGQPPSWRPIAALLAVAALLALGATRALNRASRV